MGFSFRFSRAAFERITPSDQPPLPALWRNIVHKYPYLRHLSFSWIAIPAMTVTRQPPCVVRQRSVVPLSATGIAMTAATAVSAVRDPNQNQSEEKRGPARAFAARRSRPALAPRRCSGSGGEMRAEQLIGSEFCRVTAKPSMSWANSRVGATQKRSSSCAIFHKHRLFEAR